MSLLSTLSRVIHSTLATSLLVCFASQATAAPLKLVEYLHFDDAANKLHCSKSVVFSGDDKFAYASAYCDDALNIFSRNPATGQLSLISSLVGDENLGVGLSYVESIAMHPSGKYLFAFGYTGSSSSTTNPFHAVINVYDRDINTGLLSFKSEFNNPLIDSTWSMHISSDGHYLYVGRQAGIEVIQISGNGILTHSQSVHDLSKFGGYSNSDDSIMFSADEKYIYADTGSSNTIAWYQRDAISGGLTYGGEIQPAGTSAGGNYISKLGKSHDGKHLYAFVETRTNGISKTTLRHFAIGNDGSLTYVDEVQAAPASNSEDFYCPSDVLLSANDRLVYFADYCANNFQVWLRDTGSGKLNFLGAEDRRKNDGIPETAFSQLNDLIFSNDGHFISAAVNGGITTLELTADTGISANYPKSVAPNESYTTTFTLANAGPADAHDLVFTLTGTALSAVKSVKISQPQGICKQTDTTIVCNLPSLPNKAAETIDLVLQAPDVLTTALQINISKTQAEIDPDSATDALQISIAPKVIATASSSAQASSVQASSSQASTMSSSSAQSSAPVSGASPVTPAKSGKSGGAMDFEWILLLTFFAVFFRGQDKSIKINR